MGLFSFISKLFKKSSDSEPLVLETVELDAKELSKWFNERVNASFSQISGEIKLLFRSIDEEIASAEKNLESLGNARLMNDNLPEKIRIVLDGNREAHIEKNRNFLQGLILPEKITYESISELCDNFQRGLAELARNTTKSYQILQEFFADESGEIAQNLKALDSYIRKMREGLNNRSGDVNLVDDARDMIKQLNHKIMIKTEALKAYSEEGSKVNNLISEKRNVENQIQQMKGSSEFTELENYMRRKEALKTDVFSQKQELHGLFLPLEKPLKKFEHMNPDASKLVGFYLGNELDALKLDKDLKIINVLSQLRESMNSGAIDLNEKLKERATEAISMISTQRLNSILESVNGKKRSIEDLDKRIKLINIGNDLEDMKYKMKHLDNKIKNAQTNREKVDRAVDKMDIIGLKLDIQKKIKELFSVNLIIFQDYGEKKEEPSPANEVKEQQPLNDQNFE